MTFKKVARVILYITAGFVLLFAVIQLIINLYINKKLGKELQERVDVATKHQYTLVLGSAKVSLFGRSVSFSDIELKPRPCKNCLSVKYSATAKKISIEGVSIWYYIRNKSISAMDLKLEDFALNIYQSHRLRKKDDTAAVKLSLYQIISKKINSLAIENIKIENAKFKIFNKDSLEVLFSDRNNMKVEKFLVDKQVDSLERVFLADKLLFTMKSISYKLPDGLYTLEGKNLHASYSDSIISIDSLNLKPNFKKKDFNEAAGKRISRSKLSTESVKFNGINVQLFFEYNWLVAKSIDINKMDLNVYRDNNAVYKPEKRPSFQKIIRSIPFLVKIDSININNANVVYEHIGVGEAKEAVITFNKLNGSITGLRNDSDSYNGKLVMLMRLKTKFMNKSPISALYKFPLNTDKEIFDCSGTIGALELKEVNTILKNVVSVTAESGKVDSVWFSFHAGDSRATGKMKFMYHDLKIDILHKDRKDQKLKQKILSFLANKAIVKDANPKNGESVRVTEIDFNRDPNKYLFFYTWKALQSGIMPAIGVPNPKWLVKISEPK